MHELLGIVRCSCPPIRGQYLEGSGPIRELHSALLLTIIVLAVEVGHVVEEDVGRDGHFLLPTLYVPVGQRDFPWKEKYYFVFLLRRR